MTIYEIVNHMLDVLEREQMDCMLVGAVATAAWSIPRSTTDADFVLRAPSAAVEGLFAKLPASFHVDPQARMELFTGTQRWVVGVEGSSFKVEIFLLGTDAHHALEWERRTFVWLNTLKRKAWIATGEDLIIQKLRWARHKDLQDVHDIVLLQGDALDFPYIESWCDRHGTRERLEELRRSIPPGI